MSEMDSSAPDLPRDQLLRVLALDEDAAPAEVQRRGLQLLRALRARRASTGDPAAEKAGSGPDSDTALAHEIEALEHALARHARAASRRGRRRRPQPGIDRLSAVAMVLGAACAALLFFSTGDDADRPAPRSLQGMLRLAPARLQLTGPLTGATLRVFDPDRRRVLHERPAQDASIELRPGRYAIEVERADCPERWTRSFFFESGTTRTFAPTLCGGEGALRVLSNVEDARVTIDGEPVEASDDGVRTLAAGDHVVRVEKPGHRAHQEQVRIEADRTFELVAELAPTRPRVEAASDARALLSAAAPFEPPRLQPPAPFDLGDLREQVAPPRAKDAATRLLERAGLGALPDGGSTTWHDRVANEFLRRFDSDGSGRIDRLEESDGISCVYWRETEASFEQGGLGLSMARYYGFDGTEWHPGALGFDRTLRGAVYERMRACGLQA